MEGHATYQPKGRLAKWFESRLPVIGLVHSSFIVYPTPRNLNYWWTFGAILSLMLGVQVLTGVIPRQCAHFGRNGWTRAEAAR